MEAIFEDKGLCYRAANWTSNGEEDVEGVIKFLDFKSLKFRYEGIFSKRNMLCRFNLDKNTRTRSVFEVY